MQPTSRGRLRRLRGGGWEESRQFSQPDASLPALPGLAAAANGFLAGMVPRAAPGGGFTWRAVGAGGAGEGGVGSVGGDQREGAGGSGGGRGGQSGQKMVLWSDGVLPKGRDVGARFRRHRRCSRIGG